MTLVPALDNYVVNQFGTAVTPALPLLNLTEAEQNIITRLQVLSLRERWLMELTEAYYRGEQVIENLRIAIPKELEFLRTIVGWPALAVDPYVERLAVDSFRLPTSDDADAYLTDLWTEGGLSAELPLSTTDALSIGRSYWMVGSPQESGAPPRVTVESPINFAVEWDAATGAARLALGEFWRDERRHAVLMVPGLTTTLATDDNGQWMVVDRDSHDLEQLPIVRMAHRPRTHQRGGVSAITPAIRSITDSACRTLLGMEVAREFYSVPQKIILGASESDFQGADGSPKSAWQTYITSVLALEKDDEGEKPEIKQLTAYDPATFTKLMEMYASQMASNVAAPPQDLGLYTQGNPVSAEQVEASENRRNRRARLMQSTFSPALVEVMKLMVRFENKGQLPDQYARMAAEWYDVDEVPISLASDAISKQVAAGSVPATSDVVLKKLGYSAIERRRLARDRAVDQGASFLQEVAHSLTARAARADSSLDTDLKASPSAPAEPSAT